MIVFILLVLRQSGYRLVKRRQALVETNLSRNSQLETHRSDELGSRVELAPPLLFGGGLCGASRIDRFPHALKNSQRVPTSWSAVPASFELLRGLVSQGGVEPEPVVIMLDELFEVGVQLVDVLVFVYIDLLPLEGLDEALAEGIVVRIAGAAHAGQDAVDVQKRRVLLGSVLDAAIGVMHQAGAG